MQTAIRIGMRQEFDNADINEMYRLRARVFHGRLGWDLPTIAGMEIDGYDALGPHYMLIHADDGQLRGCWRLMPTEGPNMLKDTFPQLLHGAQAPVGRDIWELSRFAIETSGEEQSFGFTDLTIHAIQEVCSSHGGWASRAMSPLPRRQSNGCCAGPASTIQPARGAGADRRRAGGRAERRGECEDADRPVWADGRGSVARQGSARQRMAAFR